TQRTPAGYVFLRPCRAEVRLVLRRVHSARAIPEVDHRELPRDDVGPVRVDVTGVGAILVSERNDDQLLRHLRPNLVPFGLLRVLVVDRLERTSDRALPAASRDEEWARAVVEQERLDEVRAVRVLRVVPVELDVAPLDPRLQLRWTRIAGIVDLQ